MTLKVYSIRDAKAEVYNLPFYKKTHGEAERDFITAVNDDQTMINKYPDDYDLYFMGEYDDNKGTFKGLDTPQHMTKAVTVLRPKE